MKDVVTNLTEKFRQNHRFARRCTAMLLVLALVTTLFVNWRLHGVGYSATADYLCGYEEHEHTEACYEKVLICGYEEGEPESSAAAPLPDDAPLDEAFGADAEPELPEAAEQPTEEAVQTDDGLDAENHAAGHVHTDACYEVRRILTCYEDEHVHTDDCFDPETNALICDQFEHTHSDKCYKTEQVLVCGKTEGEPDTAASAAAQPAAPAVNEEQNTVELPAASAAKPVAAEVIHHHTDACYEERLVCTLPEHHHTVDCLTDPLADAESEEDWLAQTDTTLTGNWPKDLITVASSQLGYTESSKSFKLDTEDEETRRGCSRYGVWYGNPYGEWDVMFLSYCLHYADIPQEIVPQRSGVQTLHSELRGSAWLRDGDGTTARVGDIVLYTGAAGVDTVGIVTEADAAAASLLVISGDVDGQVAEVLVSMSSVSSVISLTGAYAAQSSAPPEDAGGADADSYEAGDTCYATAERTGEVSADGVAAIAEGDLSLADYITTVTYEKETTPGSDVWETLDVTAPVPNGTKVRVKLSYTLNQNVLGAGHTELVYQIPKGMALSMKMNGLILDVAHNNKPVGTYTIGEDGEARLTFTDYEYVHGAPFDGTFTLEAVLNYFDAGAEGKVKFKDNCELTIQKPDMDIQVDKACDGSSPLTFDKDGNIYIKYIVTASTQNGTDGQTVTLSDMLNYAATNPYWRMIGQYVENSVSLEKKKNDGTTETLSRELIQINNKAGTAENADLKTLVVADLPALERGEQYVLRYQIVIPPDGFGTLAQNPDGTGKITNYVQAQVKNGPEAHEDEKITFGDTRITKTGTYDISTGLITWTITVRPPNRSMGGFLRNYKITDSLPEGVYIVGDVTVKGSNNVQKTVAGKDFAEKGYTIPDTSEFGDCASYTITFQTNIPEGKTSVLNTAKMEKGDVHYEASKEVGLQVGDWALTKTRAKTEGEIAYWDIDAVNSEGKTAFTLKDSISNAVDQNGNVVAGTHYAYADELQAAIETGLTLLLRDGTDLNYTAAAPYLTIQYLDDSGSVVAPDNHTTPVRSFTIAVSKTEGSTVRGIAVKNIPTREGRTTTPGGDTWTYANRADILLDGSSVIHSQDTDSYRSYKTLEKLVSTDGGNNYDTDSTLARDEVNKGILHYRLVLMTGADDTAPITLTDTMENADKVQLVAGSGKLYVDETEVPESSSWSAVHENGILTLKVSGYNRDGKQHRIEYHYDVDISADPRWNDKAQNQVKYINTATWGNETAETVTTVTKNVNAVEKHGEQLTNEQGILIDRARYTVFINPDGKDLSANGDDAKSILLEDTLSASTGATAYGDRSSVKLYYYKFENGQITYTQEVESGRYRLLEPDADSWLRMEVPNRTPMVLVYECTIDPGSSRIPVMNNEVTLSDKYRSGSNGLTMSQASAATASQGQLVLNKTDSYSGQPLAGAIFTIEAYAAGAWNEVARETTPANGMLRWYITDTGTGSTLKPNTLYRILEQDAPAGYRKDSTAHYVIFHENNVTDQFAYNKATGVEDGLNVDGETIWQNQVTYGLNTGVTTLQLENVYTQLTVHKIWLDETTNQTTAPAANEILVQLYRYTDDPNAREAVGDPVTLNTGNGWAYTWQGTEIPPQDDAGNAYYYMVEELTSGNWNVYISNNDGIQTGEITIQNLVYTGFRLPSTGGSGSALFGLLGGSTAAVAAWWMLRRRRVNHKKGE